MRHQKKTIRLGRKAAHRNALLANQVCSLIEHHRIQTTLAKAKAVRPLAERMVTLGKNGTLHARRTAFSVLRQKDAVKKLFDEIAPKSTSRSGGYTRIIKLGQRQSDSAAMALIEWVDAMVVEEASTPKEKQPKEKPPKEKAAEPSPKRKEKQPTAEKKEKEPAAAPAEEAKPKKRRWFGRKSDDAK